jgi:hypothetical protein
MTKRIAALAAAVLFSIIFLALVFLPLIIRKAAMSHGKEWFGREISLAKLKVNYFTGTVRLIDFKMFEADDTSEFVSFDTLIIDTEPYQLIRSNFVIEQIILTGLHTNMVMYDSTFNFDDLIEFYTSDTTETVTSDTLTENSLRYEFSNLELRNASFAGLDVAVNKQINLQNINFFVPYVAWNQEEKSQAGLKFDFGNGGYFQSDVNIDPTGGDFIAYIIIKDLGIAGYSEYATKFINLGKITGSTDLKLTLEGNINRPGEGKISGILEVNDFTLHDHKERPLAEAEKISVGLKSASIATMNILFDSLTLTAPHLYVQIHDSTMNLIEYANQLMPVDTLQTETNIVEEENMESDSSSWFIAMDQFTIRDGIVDISDKRTGEPFRYNLSKIEISSDSITSDMGWVELYSSMLLNNRGKLIASAGFNPINPMDLTLDYTITDFMLSDLNIYSRHYMGFPILYGDMYYKAHTDIREGIITSENKLVIHNVELGNKGGGLYDLPLKFALFLLKDKDGVITLELPVRGDLKDPQLSFGKIIWNVFKNLILKAAAAPGKLLAGILGADPKQIESIEYDYLDTTLTSDKKNQLTLLLELERLKPELEIELVYFNDPELEKKEVALAEVAKLFFQKTGKDSGANNGEFELFVKELSNTDSVALKDACLRIVEQPKLDSLYRINSNIRISQITQFLKNSSDSTQIQVIDAFPEAPKNIGSKPVFEVKYGLKEESLP